mgnify:FL=1
MLRYLRKLYYRLIRKLILPKTYTNLYWCEIRDKQWQITAWKLLCLVKKYGMYTCYVEPVSRKKYWDDVRSDEFIIHADPINVSKPLTAEEIKRKEKELIQIHDRA